MEIREVTQYHKDAPFSGYGVWILFELKHRKTQLLHPIHLTELILSEYEIIKGSGSSLWPVNKTGSSFNVDKFKQDFKDRVKWHINNGHGFPVPLVAKVIAELDDISQEEAIAVIGAMTEHRAGKRAPSLFNKANRSYALRENVDTSKVRGRPAVIVTAFKENGPASIYQIAHLVDGRLKTKSDLNRVVTYFVHKLTSQGILEIVA